MCSWVAHHMSVYWLFLGHWSEYSVVSVLRLWSILVELDLGVSHLVLILVHLASLLGKGFVELVEESLEYAGTNLHKEKVVGYKLSVGVALKVVW